VSRSRSSGRAGDCRLVESGASGILLGHFPDAEYTEGVIEATNRQGEFFAPETTSPSWLRASRLPTR